MFREITEKLIEWKNDSNRKPLMVTGVRQCGKTYIIRSFAREYFKSCIYIYFEESEMLSAVFDYDYDVKRIIHELELHFRTEIVPGETCVFLDEIQECPRAITSLKYFCENMRELHLICAGSLLGVAIRKKQVSFPVGKVNRLDLHPMNFREFAMACGKENLIRVLESWPADRAIPDLYAVPMRKLLKEFYVVGGMPEAVKTWTETGSIEKTEKVQSDILRDYADDFSKHAQENTVVKIRWIWDSIPVQLARENRKFMFSHVKEGKRAADLEDALQWLVDAGLVSKLYLVENPESPLSGFADKTYFKVYMCDMGLFVSMLEDGVQFDILHGNLYGYKGAIFENLMADFLVKMGCKLYYYRKDSGLEIDFVIRYKGKCTLVEVKSTNGNAKSAKTISSGFDTLFLFCSSRYGRIFILHFLPLGENSAF